MSTPVILGFPLWKGKIKNRIAKKYLSYFWNRWMLKPVVQEKLSHLTIGDYINDCTGFNGEIKSLYPVYRRIGQGHGAILVDVDIQTSNTGCSLVSCGVTEAKSQAEIEASTLEFLKEWTLGDEGADWYGKDTADYHKAVERANKKIVCLESGGHITSSEGCLLPEFDIHI